jgi:hypothetical protein
MTLVMSRSGLLTIELDVRFVYGLLLFSKYYHYSIKTRTYIRFFDGEATS